MKKVNSFIPFALVMLLLAGCGQAADVSGGDSGKDNQAESKHKQEKDKEVSAQKQENKPKKNQQKKPQPYAPIQPSQDTKSLKEDVTTLRAGKKDLTNGPLKKHRIVSYYGTPLSDQMGVLGEGTPDEAMKKLKRQTKAYSEADPSHQAVPAIELIASTAQRDPGPNGLYVSRLSKDVIEQYAKLAKENKALLILDVQLGQDTVMNEVKALEPFLKLPYVHLAIDTEFHVKQGQVPGEDLGHVDGAKIQKAIDYLNRLVEKRDIPDKMVMVHEFQEGIITSKSLIKPTNHVEVVMNADGFGKASAKKMKYRNLVKEGTNQYGGLKLFYSKDKPLLSPKEVIKLEPSPAVVNYQ
ncbi:hypothetical protein EV207_13722 [Scopulibacillus darangshiensis]|uniref:Lipoprotein n=1 Tax=Scopulibacillus darangshiensis TaxID=442528 RepID=A0A4R2NLQ1_9BACL|nr:hypothetical protein [Scopulibacillus darangshiensis]TCP22134.1 hypothetical protein EV207_13722 [Scopulibacillus darangshiensis]